MAMKLVKDISKKPPGRNYAVITRQKSVKPILDAFLDDGWQVIRDRHKTQAFRGDDEGRLTIVKVIMATNRDFHRLQINSLEIKEYFFHL